ncbi:GATA transcription factor 26-like protein [Tanacetum coccineum]
MAWKAIVSSPEVAKENKHQIVESGHLLYEVSENRTIQASRSKSSHRMDVKGSSLKSLDQSSKLLSAQIRVVSKCTYATPEELASMRSQANAHINCQLIASQILKQRGNDLHSQGIYSEVSEKYLRQVQPGDLKFFHYVRDTPMWRLGPPSKRVLCNACGTRWRTRGTLDAYVPKQLQEINNVKTEEIDNSTSSSNMPNTKG